MQVDLMGERWKLIKMSCKIKFFPFTYVGKFRQIDVNVRSNGPFKILKLPLGYLNLSFDELHWDVGLACFIKMPAKKPTFAIRSL